MAIRTAKRRKILKVIGILLALGVGIAVCWPRPFVCGQLSVVLRQPRGGETWTVGSTRIIAWEYTIERFHPPVPVLLSRDGGETWETIFASEDQERLVEANVTSFTWKVAGPPSDERLIGVEDITTGSISCSDVLRIVAERPCEETTDPTSELDGEDAGSKDQ